MSKPVIRRKLKNLPLMTVGMGLDPDQLRDVTKEIDGNIEKMSCCQQATIRVGLVMAHMGMDLKDVIRLQADLNHLIKWDEEAKDYHVSRAFMGVLKQKGN